VPLGETVEFRATARMSDGSIRDVTAEAAWSAGSHEVSIEGAGRVSGFARGQTQINVGFEARRGSRLVMILPRGTYRLSGRVREADGPTTGIEAAVVDATSATGGRVITETDAFGTYWLYGVAGDTTLRVTREGYRPAAQKLVVSDHQARDIDMSLARPRADVAGTYQLTSLHPATAAWGLAPAMFRMTFGCSLTRQRCNRTGPCSL
jgi:hypothetical protein